MTVLKSEISITHNWCRFVHREGNIPNKMSIEKSVATSGLLSKYIYYLLSTSYLLYSVSN